VTVAVIAGEQSEEFVRRNFTRAKVKSIKAADISAAMMEVLSNRADVGFGDAGTVAKFAQAQPATVDIFRANPWNVQAISWAVRTSEPRLLGFLNNAIEVLESNGTLRQILIKPEYNEIPILTINANPTLIAR
jgi:ABC-type amino acid transport substrate-binding protein